MSTGLKPWRFEIAWANPYTSPPDDQPRVLMSVTRVQRGGHPFPEEITRRYAKIGYGTGWCTRCSIDPDYVGKERLARSLSPAQKSRSDAGAGARLKSERQAARASQKSSNFPLMRQQRRAMIRLAPSTVQNMPDCFRREPMTVLHPASMTPEPTNNPCARN